MWWFFGINSLGRAVVTVVSTHAPNVHYGLAVPAFVVFSDASRFARSVLALNSTEGLAVLFAWQILLTC
jgi:hypothetical protein